MSTYQERLKQAMDRAQVGRVLLANKLGVSPQAISQVLNGSTKMFDASNHSKACEALGCRPVWLAMGTGPMQDHRHQLASASTLAEPPAAYLTLGQLVERLGAMLAEQDEIVRTPAATLLAELARRPYDAASIASMITAMVEARSKRAA